MANDDPELRPPQLPHQMNRLSRESLKATTPSSSASSHTGSSHLNPNPYFPASTPPEGRLTPPLFTRDPKLFGRREEHEHDLGDFEQFDRSLDVDYTEEFGYVHNPESALIPPRHVRQGYRDRKSRQSRLLLVSLLENFCALYDQSPDRNRRLFFVICRQLHSMGLIDMEDFVDEMSSVRTSYKRAFRELVLQAMQATRDDFHIEHPTSTPILGHAEVPPQSGPGRRQSFSPPLMTHHERAATYPVAGPSGISLDQDPLGMRAGLDVDGGVGTPNSELVLARRQLHMHFEHRSYSNGMGGHLGSDGRSAHRGTAPPSAVHGTFNSPANMRTGLTPLIGIRQFQDLLDFHSSRFQDDFVQISLLGRGAFGEVFEVRNKLDSVHYAIKRVKLDGPRYGRERGGEKLEKILREVKLQARFAHPNVVRYFAAWLEHAAAVSTQKSRKTRTMWGMDDFSTGDSADIDASSGEEDDDESKSLAEGTVEENDSEDDDGENGGSDSLPFMEEDSISTSGVKIEFVESDSVYMHSSQPSSLSKSYSSGGHQRETDGGQRKEKRRRPVKVADHRSPEVILASTPEEDLSADIPELRTPRTRAHGMIAMGLRSGGDSNGMMDHSPIIVSPARELTLFIQMELCMFTLQDWLKARNDRFVKVKKTDGEEAAWRTVDEDANLGIFRDICNGLHYVHSEGVIHRDVKPKNIYWKYEPRHHHHHHRINQSTSIPLSSPNVSTPSNTNDSTANTSTQSSSSATYVGSSTSASTFWDELTSRATSRRSEPSRRSESVAATLANCFMDVSRPGDPRCGSRHSGRWKIGDFGLVTEDSSEAEQPEAEAEPSTQKDGKRVAFSSETLAESESGDGSTPPSSYDIKSKSDTGRSLGTSSQRRRGTDPMERTANVGTAAYASPEQLNPKSVGGAYTTKADMYSAGIILFELFYPVETRMERAMVFKGLREGVLPDEFVKRWPKEAMLVLWLLFPQPDDRPSAADVLAFELMQQTDPATPASALSVLPVATTTADVSANSATSVTLSTSRESPVPDPTLNPATTDTSSTSSSGTSTPRKSRPILEAVKGLGVAIAASVLSPRGINLTRSGSSSSLKRTKSGAAICGEDLEKTREENEQLKQKVKDLEGKLERFKELGFDV